DKVVKVVKENIAGLNPAYYYQAKVQVIYNDRNQIDYLLVYLLSAQNYSFTITKIKINENYQVLSTTPDYQLQPNDFKQQPRRYEDKEASCPDESIEFVSATCVPGIATAKEAIETVYDQAVKEGYKAMKLLGDEASVQNYKNWLMCPN